MEYLNLEVEHHDFKQRKGSFRYKLGYIMEELERRGHPREVVSGLCPTSVVAGLVIHCA